MDHIYVCLTPVSRSQTNCTNKQSVWGHGRNGDHRFATENAMT